MKKGSSGMIWHNAAITLNTHASIARIAINPKKIYDKSVFYPSLFFQMTSQVSALFLKSLYFGKTKHSL